jgi:hypothetical protein
MASVKRFYVYGNGNPRGFVLATNSGHRIVKVLMRGATPAIGKRLATVPRPELREISEGEYVKQFGEPIVRGKVISKGVYKARDRYSR